MSLKIGIKYSVEDVKNFRSYFNIYKGILGNKKTFPNECIVRFKWDSKYSDKIIKDKILYSGSSNGEYSTKDGRNGNFYLEQAVEMKKDYTIHFFYQKNTKDYYYLGKYWAEKSEADPQGTNKIFTLIPCDKDSLNNVNLNEITSSEFKEKALKNELNNLKKNNLNEKFNDSIWDENFIDKIENLESPRTIKKIVSHKIEKMNYIHNHLIQKYIDTKKEDNGYIKSFDGIFGDLYIEYEDFVEIYEFKTVNRENFKSQFYKAIGQICFYEYLFFQSDRHDKNKEIRKIIYLGYDDELEFEELNKFLNFSKLEIKLVAEKFDKEVLEHLNKD